MSPFTVVEDDITSLTYRCPCGILFSTDAYTMENMHWDAKAKLWYAVCPKCGLDDKPEEPSKDSEERVEF